MRFLTRLRTFQVNSLIRRGYASPASSEVVKKSEEPKQDAPAVVKPKEFCSPGVKGLMDFFDDRKNWGETEIKVGRSWRKGELRIRSNADLHKLWYVLLKEKNMLLTTERECNEEAKVFANPERIDKVEESMRNVEEVIRERNRAYHELETGTSGERPGKWALSWIGLPTFYKKFEHLIPKELNGEFQKRTFYRTRLDDGFRQTSRDVRHFLALQKEKEIRTTAYHRRIQYLTAIATVKKFPNVNLEALQREFPLISVEKLLKSHYMRDLNLWRKLDAEK